MYQNNKTHQSTKSTSRSPGSSATVRSPQASSRLPSGYPEQMLQLQRQVGNSDVQFLLQPSQAPRIQVKLTPGNGGDANVYPIQRQTSETAEPATAESFTTLWSRFGRLQWSAEPEAARALVPQLISQMGDSDAQAHGMELAFWLIEQGDWAMAQRVLGRLRQSWQALFAAGQLPVPGLSFHNPVSQLITRAHQEETASQHSRAIALLKLAFVLVQMQIHVATTRREGYLASLAPDPNLTGPAYTAEAERARAVSGGMIRLMTYYELGRLYELMRDIIGFYHRRERDAIAASDASQTRIYSNLGFVLNLELRDLTLPESQRALVLESSATEQGGRSGYTIHGADSQEEFIDPLPGTPTTDQMGFFPFYSSTMGQLLETLSGQETFITGLLRHPEIRTAFGTRAIDMNNQATRLQVWQIMYGIYQREDIGFGPLGALLNLIESYLRHYTLHSEYNIRDFGVSYLSSEFPEDLIGRVVRDCGAYALTVAYEVYRTVRQASPRLPIDFRIYTTTDHATLAIFDRDQDNFYIVNNNDIRGPYRDDLLSHVAQAHAGTATVQTLITPAMAADLGSTSLSESRFRRQIWQRYQAVTRWGFRAEAATGPSDQRTEGERSVDAQRHYYQAREQFDQGAQRVHRALDQLPSVLTGAEAADRPRILSTTVTRLITVGEAMVNIFMQYGPNADLVSPSRLTRSIGQVLYFYTTGRPDTAHPLVRLGRALLFLEGQGVPLSPEGRTLLQQIRRIDAFNTELDQYIANGRPASF